MLRKASIAALSVLIAAVLAGTVHAEGADTMNADNSPAVVSSVNQSGQWIIMQQSSKMYAEGKLFLASQPTVEAKGVTFVAARSLGTSLGLKVTYYAATKEYEFTSADGVAMRYKLNSASYKINGAAASAGGAVYVKNGTLMVPLRSLVTPLQMKLAVNNSLKQIVVTRSGTTAPPTTPTPSPTPTPTPVNEPPVASFTTDKQQYKIGERIIYTDQSTDDKGIVKTEWTNNETAFFEPGSQTVSLKVTDKEGLVSEISQTIVISSEVLYTKEQYDRLYTPIGDKFAIPAASVLQMPAITYAIEESGQQTLIRANSPETIVEEGVYYSDTVSGNVRFLIHNQNNRTSPVRIYVIATNENTDGQPVTVTTGKIGIGGPSTYVSATGKMALARYLEASPQGKTTVIPAGESRITLTSVSDQVLTTGKVITAHADVQTSGSVRLSVVVVDADKDPLALLPFLPALPWDGKHARGTFEHGDRTITLSAPLGGSASRIVLGDQTYDSYQKGYDVLSGFEQVNSGNYGVNYKLVLEHVQPNTLIALNARGGHYGGAFLVNGKLTYMTNENILTSSGEAGVLYRTGNTEENVTIVFSPASGSNLPIHMMFIPLPAAQ
ncbi:stalk domain-containing protein [Paenibacillus radicis (ex Gao et al. 2016)]|uniref:Copper amine oxidase-like N-terminal domain-containing protein n=1 Tax=Paenibacillus radicis (ex Gao et al. 2016) TaxID=1737354 RepID=A0A917GRI0_9BACL|nr:stalk domain-containing protein [Paenibacillus radicis (ex Gao et al. 2016)]GGG55205.1 hypothetical protein GCM10010918_05070 [Paenibacillus radicis (ex Gao et al. 2016)]